MIDINKEHLIRIHDVPRRLPRRPTGKQVHISAVYRWIKRGVRGVFLESVKIGGSTYTSEEALQRFADQRSNPTAAAASSNILPQSRQKRIEHAAQQIKKLLE